MKTHLKSLAVSILILSGSASVAQEVLDGVYIKENTPTRKVVPYTHVREADVLYTKRVWRMVELAEKQNYPMKFPNEPINELGYVRMSLIDVIKQGIDEGTIQAYDSEISGFTVKLTQAEASDKMQYTEIVTDYDENGFETQTELPVAFSSADVVRFEIKEDWFFDRERSVMDVRIIGIAPIYVNPKDQSMVRPFVIYFPEARYVFANAEVYSSGNDGARMTFDDYFWKRMFSSYIYQETNVYDNRKLTSYKSGIDLLLESNKIMEEIVNFEHDMWQY
ncbi:gliding motility protein GldN [bacterium]|nr:gliding motility protein GldN [bacterium]